METDQTLLSNSLAKVNGETDLELFEKGLRLGDLELVFDENGKLIRLRIRESLGKVRPYSVYGQRPNA